MSATTLNTKFQLRRDDEESWLSVDPVLADGEPVLALVDGVYKMKIGDGESQFSELAYYGGSGAGGDADWNTLLNKPFYEKQVAEKNFIIDYTKETNLSGTIGSDFGSADFIVCKISDKVYTADTIKNLLYSYEVRDSNNEIIDSDTLISIVDADLEIDPVSIIVHLDGTNLGTNGFPMLISVLDDDVTINGFTVEEKGLYAYSCSISGYRTWKCTACQDPAHTEIKKINKKFLYLDWDDIENKPLIQDSTPQIQKMTDYLYYLDANFDFDYEDGLEYIRNHLPEETENNSEESENDGNCTAFRKGDLFGRNLDWKYAETAEYIINIPATKGRHASIGVATGLTELTNSVAESGEWDDLYKVLPFCTVDGINDQGVTIECNTVYLPEDDRTVIDNGSLVVLSMLMIPRYILDYANSAAHAIELLENIDIFNPPAQADFDLHYLLADENETYILEWLKDDNDGYELSAIKLPDSDNHLPISTNFYLNDYFKDGSINGGGGKNRYDIIAQGYRDIETQKDAFDLLAKAYLTIINEETLENRDGTQHHTTHSVVYNIPAKTMAIRPQPDVEEPSGKEFRFSVNNNVWATADWENITNKPFGDITIPATYYDIRNADENVPPIDASSYGELKEYYVLSGQAAQFPGLMSNTFSIDYDLNDGEETITILSTDCEGGFFDEFGEEATMSSGAYAVLNYTDEDDDNILTAIIVYKDLSENDEPNQIVYNDITISASQGDVITNKYYKFQKTNDINSPIRKRAVPIKCYNANSLVEYDFDHMYCVSDLDEGNDNVHDDNPIVLLYYLDEFNLNLDDWKNAIDFGCKYYDPETYDPDDPTTYEIESIKSEINEYWNNPEFIATYFTDDYDMLDYIIQIKKPNTIIEIDEESITFEYPGLYLIKGFLYDDEYEYTMEAYLHLNERQGVKKLDKKYTYSSWNDLDDKPFGDIVHPAVTYRIPGNINNSDLQVFNKERNITKYIYNVTDNLSEIIYNTSNNLLYYKCIATIDGIEHEYMISYSDMLAQATFHMNESTGNLDYAYISYTPENTNYTFEGFIVQNENGCDIEELNSDSYNAGMYVIVTNITELNDSCTNLITKRYILDALLVDPINCPCDVVDQTVYNNSPDLVIDDGEGHTVLSLYRVADEFDDDYLDGGNIILKNEIIDSESPNYGRITYEPAILADVTSEVVENATDCKLYANSENDDIMLLNVTSTNATITGEGPGGIILNVSIDTTGLYASYNLSSSEIDALYSVGICQPTIFEGQSIEDTYTIQTTDDFETILIYDVGSTDFLTQTEAAQCSMDYYIDNTLYGSQNLTPEIVASAWYNPIPNIDMIVDNSGYLISLQVKENITIPTAENITLSQGIKMTKTFIYDTTNNQVHNFYYEINRPKYPAIKKIDSKYLPKGSTGGVASWNDLEDKPFDSIEVEKINITTSLPSISRTVTLINGSDPQSTTINLYKISDIPFNLQDWSYLAVNGSTQIGTEIEISASLMGILGQTPSGSLSIVVPGSIEILTIAEDNDKISESTGISYTITGLDNLEKGSYIGQTYISYAIEHSMNLSVEAHEHINPLDEKYIKSINWEKITNPPFGKIWPESLSAINYNLADFENCGGSDPTINQVVEVNSMRYYRVGDAITLKQLQGLTTTYYYNAYINDGSLRYSSKYLQATDTNPDLIIKELPNNNKNCYGVYYKSGNNVYPYLLNLIETPQNSFYVQAPWQTSSTNIGNTNTFTSGLYIGIQETVGTPNKYDYIQKIQSYGSYSAYYQKLGQEYLDLSNVDTTLTPNTQITNNNINQSIDSWVNNKFTTQAASKINSTTILQDVTNTPTIDTWVNNKFTTQTASKINSTTALQDIAGAPSLASWVNNKFTSQTASKINSTTTLQDVTNTPTLVNWVQSQITTNRPYTINVSSSIPASGTPNTTITFII